MRVMGIEMIKALTPSAHQTAAALLCVLALSAATLAQASPDTSDVLQYDVVSIKLNKSKPTAVDVRMNIDGLRAVNVTLDLLIANAYSIRRELILDVPSWVQSTHFDMEAKLAASDAEAYMKRSYDQRGQMLQPVLADRFKLKVHTETRVLPVYELVLAKGGSRLTPANPASDYVPQGTGRPGTLRLQPGELTAQSVPITDLVRTLSNLLQRTVVDKTGLTAKYDLKLSWAAQQDGPAPSGDDNAPSLFTAIQEQLGLRLQSAKDPVEALVVDHVEQPTEN